MKIFFVLLILTLPLICRPQMVITLDKDSSFISDLEKKFNHASSDSLKAINAFTLSSTYKRIKDTVKARQYLQEGTLLSRGNPFLEATSQFYEAFLMLGQYDNATVEKKLRQSDSLLKKFDFPAAFKTRANIWITLGVLEQIKGSEKNALDAYMNQALPFAKKSHDDFIQGNANKFIGIIFLNSEERDKAATYLQTALRFFERSRKEENPTRLEAILETSIISAENDVYRKKMESAKATLDKASQILAPYPNSNVYLFYYYVEGIYFDRLKEYTKAINSFNKGISMIVGKAENYYINRLKYAKFSTLLNLKQYNGAISTMLDLLKSPLIFPTDRKIYYKELATTYAQTGNMREAYNWSQQYITISDSLYDKKYRADLVELEKKYETAEKENKITQLEAEKRKNAYEIKTARLNGLLWAIGCILFLVLAAFLYYFLRNNRKLSNQKEINHQQQLKQIRQQQQIELSEAMMRGEEIEQQRIARDLHDGLGGMLAGLKIRLAKDLREKTITNEQIDISMGQLDDSINELRRIARNMMPETLIRFGIDSSLRDLCEALSNDNTRIHYESYEISKNIEISRQIVIYRIVQEGLANALRHANASVIDLQCSQNNGTFYITIEDNGSGFDLNSLATQKGIGLKNIENRVNYLDGQLQILSVPNEGTTLHIELNVDNKA